VSSRTDLYGLAAVSYRWLTGRPPFAGRDIPSLLYEVVHTMPVRPSALADVPPDIDSVLAIGLAKSAEDRFETGRQLADAFASALSGHLAETLRRRATAQMATSPWAAG
jgi:serine/threonine protein kinase